MVCSSLFSFENTTSFLIQCNNLKRKKKCRYNRDKNLIYSHCSLKIKWQAEFF
uniref:Uncharacterized protein n=1 Tax=Rhizophora mucronata TaxID=61149 RepID=A0A2P2NPH7_RHIMU